MQTQILEKCNICQQKKVFELPTYSDLKRVTSDCQVWKNNGKIGICTVCGVIQAIIDQNFLVEIDQIYRQYSVYHQGSGAEQVVFDMSNNNLLPRSELLFSRFSQNVKLPQRGRLLDIGCGNGAFLSVFSKNAPPGWLLSGTEVNDKYIDTLESIERFEKLYVNDIHQIQGSFDIISMVHVLEHLVNPTEYIQAIRRLLVSDGLLLIEVPDFDQNPFDLLIADHCSHFTQKSLTMFLKRNGFEIISSATNWVSKEITIIARKGETESLYPSEEDVRDSLTSLEHNIHWLKQIAGEAKEYCISNRFGLFGTSIAATWLASELGSNMMFFVDEDPSRAGTTYMGKPVYPPQDIPPDNFVYIGLSPMIAEKIKKRLQNTENNIIYAVPLQNV